MRDCDCFICQRRNERRDLIRNSLILLALVGLAILLSIPFKAKGEDIYYPWPLKDPKPPIVQIDPTQPIDVESSEAKCNPANEGCENPDD